MLNESCRCFTLLKKDIFFIKDLLATNGIDEIKNSLSENEFKFLNIALDDKCENFLALVARCYAQNVDFSKINCEDIYIKLLKIYYSEKEVTDVLRLIKNENN